MCGRLTHIDFLRLLPSCVVFYVSLYGNSLRVCWAGKVLGGMRRPCGSSQCLRSQVTLCMARGGGASAAGRAAAIFRPGALRWSGSGAAADGQGGQHARRESASVERTGWWWGGASGSSCCLAQCAPPSRSRRLMPRGWCATPWRNGEALVRGEGVAVTAEGYWASHPRPFR